MTLFPAQDIGVAVVRRIPVFFAHFLIFATASSAVSTCHSRPVNLDRFSQSVLAEVGEAQSSLYPSETFE